MKIIRNEPDLGWGESEPKCSMNRRESEGKWERVVEANGMRRVVGRREMVCRW